jgi:hypothetical protein
MRSEVLLASAAKLEARSMIPSDKDDPKYLRRNARKIRQWAKKKEKAFEHKRRQEKRSVVR